MAIWEYKVISSGKGGFASPAMLEKFLNDLGKEEWEVIEFHTPVDNALAFNGLARRSTQRDWTLEDAAASAAKVEADKIRAEFEAKFKGMAPAGSAEPETALGEQVAPDDGYRSPVDTSRDQDPDAEEDESKDEWDQLVDEDDLPTFFEAIRPHMRRNQRGAGMSVGVDFLAKKWGFDESDVMGALKECGFVMPEDEDSKAAYLEYDGDLFWVNINRRGELWINTKEKPMPVFRVVPGQPIEVADEPKSKGRREQESPKQEAKKTETPAQEKSTPAKEAKDTVPMAALPTGADLLEKIRPKMRRNRHDAGGSGSVSFLTRAFKCSEADLLAGFESLGLSVPEKNGDKGAVIEIGPDVWWINKDQRGGIWINGIEKAEQAAAEKKAAAAPKEASTAKPTEPPQENGDDSMSILAKAHPFLKPARGGGVAGDLTQIAEELKQSPDDLVAALSTAGLLVPEKPRQKAVAVDFSGESYWITRNAKGVLSLNAKPADVSADSPAAKSDGEEAESNSDEEKATSSKKSRRPRPRSPKKSDDKD